MFTNSPLRHFEQMFPKMVQIRSAGRNHKSLQDSGDPLEGGLPIQTLQSSAVNSRAVSSTRTSFSISPLHPRSLDSFYNPSLKFLEQETACPQCCYVPSGRDLTEGQKLRPGARGFASNQPRLVKISKITEITQVQHKHVGLNGW